jgi:hypothetical protein
MLADSGMLTHPLLAGFNNCKKLLKRILFAALIKLKKNTNVTTANYNGTIKANFTIKK